MSYFSRPSLATPPSLATLEGVLGSAMAAQNVAMEAALLLDAIDHGACEDGRRVDLSGASRLRAAVEVWWLEAGLSAADLDHGAEAIATDLLPGVPVHRAAGAEQEP